MNIPSQVFNLEKILSPIHSQMERVEHLILKNLETDLPLLTEIGQYILKAGGKRLRPALLILSGKTFGYENDNDLCQAGNVIEYIHTATLLHDDVVDNSDMRRSKKSARAIWGNEAAILVGDYLFTVSFKFLAYFQNSEIVSAVSNATTLMAKGEILQLTRTYENCNEAIYNEVVTNKTASLIGAAMKVGGILGGANQEQQFALENFGIQLGIAFQMVDDILDYALDNQEFGKPPGNDLKEKKITLPLIHLLENASPTNQERVLEIMDEEKITDEQVREVTKLIHQYKSLEYTMEQARSVISNGVQGLSSLPKNQYRESIQQLAWYAIQRTI